MTQVADDAGRVAFERGPLVYCFEGADHAGQDLPSHHGSG